MRLGSFVGIDLTSRTGFNTQTKLTFNWLRAGKLCGSNDYPPTAARVVAKVTQVRYARSEPVDPP